MRIIALNYLTNEIFKMKNFNIYIKENDLADIPSKLRQGLINYNKPFLGEWSPVDFAISIEDENKNLIGGVSGYYADEYVIVQLACVDESYRKKGIGTILFKKLDDFTLSKKCKFIHLETMEFQAKDFYEKFGFSVVSTLPNWFNSYSLHIMRKKF